MKERSILFSAPMVRAILAGTKTQTRRVVKLQPRSKADIGHHGAGMPFIRNPDPLRPIRACPYGQPGDRLWVREAVWLPRAVSERDLHEGADTWPKCIYSADTDATEIEWLREHRWKQRPSIHCPRWASRILLEVTDVRVERLQDISAAGCAAEGVQVPVSGDTGNVLVDISTPNGPSAFLTREQFGNAEALLYAHWAALWCSINGRASWDANPWVWVVSFKRFQP